MLPTVTKQLEACKSNSAHATVVDQCTKGEGVDRFQYSGSTSGNCDTTYKFKGCYAPSSTFTTKDECIGACKRKFICNNQF